MLHCLVPGTSAFGKFCPDQDRLSASPCLGLPQTLAPARCPVGTSHNCLDLPPAKPHLSLQSIEYRHAVVQQLLPLGLAAVCSKRFERLHPGAAEGVHAPLAG